MIFYSWKKICKISDGAATTVVRIFKHLIIQQYPELNIIRLRFPRHLRNMDFSGDSFILNPIDLYKNMYKYSELELAEYIGLASFRSYPDYQLFKTTTLPIELSPMVDIKNNRLLHIENNEIHFKYEDYTKEIK